MCLEVERNRITTHLQAGWFGTGGFMGVLSSVGLRREGYVERLDTRISSDHFFLKD